jgi:hypothetical protein
MLCRQNQLFSPSKSNVCFYGVKVKVNANIEALKAKQDAKAMKTGGFLKSPTAFRKKTKSRVKGIFWNILHCN